QNEKTLRRDLLRQRGKDEIEELLSHIQDGTEENLALKLLLIDLGQRLKDHKGKKVYGYLNRQDRALVDSIVDEIENLPAVSSLYDLWYEKQNELRHIYSETDLPKLPLSANPEFKTIRNAVIKAADSLDARALSAVSGSSETPAYLAASVTRLLNNVSRIFEDKFSDNPEHIPKVDIKLRRQILEKDEAHGIKHG
ncbi:MAG: relaxase MobL, partial [Saccharofermentans sp.]|nr:relaxase MobL [Saccharofermentans sp.]